MQRQAHAGWGDAVVERLAHDLRQAFPDTEGLSPRNVWRMRAFYLAWSGATKQLTQAVSETADPRATKKLPQAVSELPWGHNIVLLQQLEAELSESARPKTKTPRRKIPRRRS